MSEGFPQMVLYPRGRLSGKADYVRRIWEQYAYHRVRISDRIDVRYTVVCSQQHWIHQEFLLEEHAPDGSSIYTQEIGDFQ